MKAKKGNNMSPKVRRAARKILTESKGRMKLGELEKKVEELLSVPLRSDFFKGALSAQRSGLDVYGGIVILARKSSKPKGGDEVRTSKKQGAKRLTPEEFVLLAISKLRRPGYKGIHSVYSEFNAAFRQYFPELDPVAEVQKLVGQGTVSIRPIKGGVLIFKADSAPPTSGAETALSKMGLK